MKEQKDRAGLEGRTERKDKAGRRGFDRPEDRRRVVFGILGFSAMITVCLAVGFYLSGLFLKDVFRLPPFTMFLITCWIGFILFWVFAWAIQRIAWHKMREGFMHPYNTLLDAMARIASGDFSVFISPNDSGVHRDLAEGINEMAKNLGNLETMRQDFISNVSHEIQSPLTSIGGFAALLKDETLTAEQRRHYADVIETESKRLSRLSENLLKLSALEAEGASLSLSQFRLDKQINAVALAMEPQWSAKNIFVEAELSRTEFYGDEGLLSQVWGNLLHNAIKFTTEGGTIRLRLDPDPEGVCFSISDTGIGIPREDQMHIFERFYKIDKSRDRSLGGNGLGLSIVKKIVELHGGRVSVESEPGKGTTFQVFLPNLHSI